MFGLNRVWLLSFLILFCLLMLFPFSIHAQATDGSIATASSDFVDIDVEHIVQIRDGGLIFINDTFKLFTRSDQKANPLNNFLMGFPFKYGSHLDYCIAFDTANPEKQYKVVTDIGLGKIGFYGINVTFPQPIDVGNGRSHNFSVVSVFSNLVVSVAENEFNVDIPLQPSLTRNASKCDITIKLPNDTNYLNSTFNYRYFQQVFSHTVSPLVEFAHKPGLLNFESEIRFLIVDVEVDYKMMLDQWGHILFSESYSIKNRSDKELPRVDLPLSQGAHTVSVKDTIGDLSVFVEKGNATTQTNATITFRKPLEKDEKSDFTVFYTIPRVWYVKQLDWRSFNLTFTMPESSSWIVKRSMVTISLPEGAKYIRFDPFSSQETVDRVQKGVFKQKVTMLFYNTTPLQHLSFSFIYDHLLFWSSFRPTLWIGTLIFSVSIIAFLWRTPKPSIPLVSIPLEKLESFVSSYEEKRGILSDLESLEQRIKKGKIPRRRYKVRKRMLEGRLSSLSRDLAINGEIIRKFGFQYAKIIRQIEVAETELEGTKTDLRRIELRYRRGEISVSAYRKLIGDSNQRRDRAKTSIDEVLLRLRGGIP